MASLTESFSPQRLTALPSDFDVALIGDDSTLPKQALNALRELAWRKAANDAIWFLENFWHVIDPLTFKWVLFKLRDYQREDAEWVLAGMKQPRWRALVLKARQIGWTTLASGLAFHDAYFTENHPWLIASQGQAEAMGTLSQRIKEPYLRLPIWLRERGPELQDNNSETMTFSNGSSILSIPATGKAGRSKTVYGTLVDEKAFIDSAEELDGALDPLTYGPKIDFSTANGFGNVFHGQWLDAQQPNSAFDARFRPWNVVPGRDAKWYEREKAKYRGKMWQFEQEYPTTPEDAFAKSGRAVLPIDLLRDEMCFCDPDIRVNLDLTSLNPSLGAESWIVLEEGQEADNELWVWEPPLVERDEQGRALRDPNYVIGADIAEGLEHGDRTSIVVMNANTGEEAAAYRGHWPIEDLGELLNTIGSWYYNALLLPERNNSGILPINDLRKHYSYPRIYRIGPLASIPRGERTPRLGYVTNKATKPKALNEFIKALRNGEIMLHDARFFEEAQTFIADGKGGFSASGNTFDDHVMGHLIAWQGVLEVGQYPTVFYDDAPSRVTFGDIMAISDWLDGDDNPHPMNVPIGGKRRQRQETPSWIF